MAAPTRTKSNVVWGIVNGWTAAADTVTPFDEEVDIDDPASGWTGLGYTAEGFSRAYSRETAEARVEEELNPVGEDVTSVTYAISLMLAEHTLENEALAMGGTVATTAAASGTIGYKTLTLDDTLENVALVLVMDGNVKNGSARFKNMIYIPSVVATGDVETEFRRSPENKRVIPVTFKATCELSDIKTYSQTAVAGV